MNRTTRIAIVVALAGTVAVVVALKHGVRPAPAPTTTPAARALPRLVDLGSTTCIPCKMMTPILEQLKAEHAGRLEVEFIDVGADPDAGKGYQIKLIPTQVFLDAGGRERFRHEGFFSKEEILAKWKELGVDLSEGGCPASQPASQPATSPAVKSGST